MPDMYNNIFAIDIYISIAKLKRKADGTTVKVAR